MINETGCVIDEETIENIGLRLSNKQINAQIAPTSRIFEYPNLNDVFIMESDLYGNKMPKGSCFLVFSGKHGLMGEQMEVENLKNLSREDIEKIVKSDKEG